MQAKNLEFLITGDEKASFTHRYHTGSGKNRRARSKKVSMAATLISSKVNAMTFGGPLMPGDYVIPFEFILPLGLPASIMFKNNETLAKPKANIRYGVKAVIENHDGTQLFYDHMLIVHEPPVPFIQNQSLQQKFPIQTWGCMQKGQTELAV